MLDQNAITQPAQQGAANEVVDASPDSGQLGALPEKFRGPGGIEQMAKSYQEAERELRHAQEEKAQLTKEADRARLLEQQLYAVQMQQRQPVHEQAVVNEEELFRREWQEDPAAAVYNQSKRSESRATSMTQDYATSMFYEQAKKDEKNYKNFSQYEPTMVAIAQKFSHLVSPASLKNPAVIPILYYAARGMHADNEVEKAKSEAFTSSSALKSEKKAAFAESSSPAGGSIRSSEDMSLEEIERLVGFVDRS